MPVRSKIAFTFTLLTVQDDTWVRSGPRQNGLFQCCRCRSASFFSLCTVRYWALKYYCTIQMNYVITQ